MAGGRGSGGSRRGSGGEARGVAGRGRGPTGASGALLPVDLLKARLGAQPTLLYGFLHLTPGFRAGTGRFTYPALSARTGDSPNTLKRAAAALQGAGWLALTQRNRSAPIEFRLGNPAADRRERTAADVRRHLKGAQFRGESLMRAGLSLLIESDEYDDDASPGYLVNPLTGEEMEFDRYYPPGVAFEFQGAQHFGPTALYPSEADARAQLARDYMKRGICQARGIRLVLLHPADLSLEGQAALSHWRSVLEWRQPGTAVGSGAEPRVAAAGRGVSVAGRSSSGPD